jgi:hypothetical protein
MRTVAAPAPNRAGHVLPHSLHTDTDAEPFNGSVVPSWSQRSMRWSSVSHSTFKVTLTPLLGRTAKPNLRQCGHV